MMDKPLPKRYVTDVTSPNYGKEVKLIEDPRRLIEMLEGLETQIE
jgi:hypothetical protein